MSSFYTIPGTKHSCWIIPTECMVSFLCENKKYDMYSLFESRIQTMYRHAQFKGDTVFLKKHTIFLYLRGTFTHRDGYPFQKDMIRLIESIASIAFIKKEARLQSIWNVCNDLSVKGGYMRCLFDQIKWYYEFFDGLYLHVAFSNPFFKRAVCLYLSKGFVYVRNPTLYNDMAITMTCPSHSISYSKEETETKFINVMKEIEQYQPHALKELV